MSISTWKQEFYPTSSISAAKGRKAIKMLDHAILKWEGLRKKNMRKHGLKHTIDDTEIRDSSNNKFEVGIGTCALCIAHMNTVSGECGTCPLFYARGRTPCAQPMKEEGENPYDQWCLNHNPEPMIAWLKATRILIEGGAI